LFNLKELFAFSVDTFIPRTWNNTNYLITDMERSLEAITKLMKQSGFNKIEKTLKNVFF
jgi:hypothetical protein